MGLHREWGIMAANVNHLGRDSSMDVVGQLLWIVSYGGTCRVMYQTLAIPIPPNEVRKSIPVGIGALGLAASTLNCSLCHVVRAGTSWGNDA